MEYKIIFTLMVISNLIIITSNISAIGQCDSDGADGEKYFENVEVLIIGRCNTKISDGRWTGFSYLGNLTIAGLVVVNKSLQRIHIIVYNKTISNQYDSFIRYTNGAVCMLNASGIFFWGAAKSGVRLISPIVFIRCHTDQLWIRDEGYSP